MPEKEPKMHPDVAAALRAYEREVLDGTERSQRVAFEILQAVRRRVGAIALTAAPSETEARDPDDQPEAA